jgi:hypothetical protein
MIVREDRNPMKNVIVVFCLAILLAISAGCASRESAVDSDISELLLASSRENGYLYAINHPIEAEYLDDTSVVWGETASMTIFYEKYTKMWKEEMFRYVDLIASSSVLDAEEKEKFLEYQEEWTAYNVLSLKYYAELETALEDGGTIIIPIISWNGMRNYRARAIELISIYKRL